MAQNLFLVGGSGFVGKHLVATLCRDYSITVIDKFVDDDFFADYPQVSTLRLDLVDSMVPESLPSPDFIINLTSIVTAERDMRLFDSLIASNLKILLNLYERFKDSETLKLFMQFGSAEEYGNTGAPFTESMREAPNSPYALVKQLTTNTALMLHGNYGFPSMVVRPGNLYGPGQNPSKFIPYITSRLKSGLPLNVTECEQKRDFIHVRRFAEIIGKLLVNYRKCIGEIVNVSSGSSIPLKSIIEKRRAELKSTSEVNYGAVPYRENEAMDLCCDISKLSSIIN